MDSFYIDPSTQDSRQNRSRSNSHLSTTAVQFQGLNITENSQSSTGQGLTSSGIPPTHFSTTSPPFSDPDSHPSPKTFISAPIPQQLTPFPLLSESDQDDANWSFLSSNEEQPGSAPLLRLDPPQPSFPEEQTFGDHRSVRSASNPGTMSTLGIQQYDSRFDAGGMHTGIRHTYTWPQFEMHEHFGSQNPSPGLSPGQLTPGMYEEPKLMPGPMYARSLSSSPPRVNQMSVEQRELKRQRDSARRDSKSRVRRERSASNTSNPYVVSQHGSPDLLPTNLPEYANSLTPSPLLSQGSIQNSPALTSTSFLNPYSPNLNAQGPSQMYGPVFTMGPNDFTSTSSFPLAYSNAGGEPGLPSFVGRPHSLSLSSAPDHASMYRMPQVSPKMGSSESGDHVRVVHSRPKPQCWEHGCNGRQFSTFSNLLRHQREKSGAAHKSSCPNCGAEFTRTTARNGHMAHDKCKSRRNS